MSKIRVMIVDDSLLVRRLLLNAINSQNDMEVVAEAGDPFEAAEVIQSARPDVMTCDIEMPKLNGLNFIAQLLPQYQIPVVMFTTLSERVFDAFDAGAVDFLAKPVFADAGQFTEFINYELAPKIRGAVGANIRTLESSVSTGKAFAVKPLGEKKTVIAIGASTGGTEAIFEVLKEFDTDVPGIVVTQHIPPKFSRMFAERINRECRVSCKEAKTGDKVMKGQVLIAPGDRHIRLVKIDGHLCVDCNSGEKVNGHRPSVDVLFDSVAKTVGKDAIGIILTGLGGDGAKGLLHMKQTGAETIGQDRETSVVYGMPMEAYRLGAVRYQLPLQNIARKVYALLKTMR